MIFKELDIKKKSSAMRVVNHWHRFPREAVDALSLETYAFDIYILKFSFFQKLYFSSFLTFMVTCVSAKIQLAF